MSLLHLFYDIRLLTPPGTPLFPSSDGSESQLNPVAPRISSLARSVSTSKASRVCFFFFFFWGGGGVSYLTPHPSPFSCLGGAEGSWI